MSSLHQDRLLAEGSEPAAGSAPALAPARGTSRRPAAEKATDPVPTKRRGTAKRSGSTQTATGDQAAPAHTRRTAGAGTLAARAKAAGTATRKVASAKAATVKTATAKAASGQAVTARAATVTAAAPAKAAAAAKVTARPGAASETATPSTAAKAAATGEPASAAEEPAAPAAVAPGTATAKPAPAAKADAAAAAKASAAKAPAAKVTTAKVTTAKAATAKAPADAAVGAPTRVRPTPHERSVPTAKVLASPTASAEPAAAAQLPDATEAPVAGTAARRGVRSLRRRPPSIGRRPALYLVAALVGAMSLSAATTGEPAALATATVSHSVSVAEELGIEATPTEAITDTAAAELLGDLSASRSVRDAEQAAAAEVQAEADRIAAEAAAEAARPKAVLPVEGARLTSQYGPRWGTMHSGIDLAAPMHTPEYAVMDGVVLEAGPASGFGLVVYIQHENGDVTVYGHMDSILVQAGQVVRAGDTIALLGNSGQSTGPHLHFEVHVGGLDGPKVDPLPWLRERGVAI